MGGGRRPGTPGGAHGDPGTPSFTWPVVAAGAVDTQVATGGFNFGLQGQCSTHWSLGPGLGWERLRTQAQNQWGLNQEKELPLPGPDPEADQGPELCSVQEVKAQGQDFQPLALSFCHHLPRLSLAPSFIHSFAYLVSACPSNSDSGLPSGSPGSSR